MEKHLPCPLCSSTNLDETIFAGDVVLHVSCRSCGFMTREKAWQALPRRATTTSAEEAMDRLEYIAEENASIDTGDIWGDMRDYVHEELTKAYSVPK